MKNSAVFESVNIYRSSFNDFLEFDSKHKLVMSQIRKEVVANVELVHSFEDSSRVHVLKNFISSNTSSHVYNDFINHWVSMNKISLEYASKMHDLSYNALDFFRLRNFSYSLIQNNHLVTESINNTFNNEKRTLLINKIVALCDNDILLDILNSMSTIDEQYLFYMSVILKLSVKLTPGLAASAIIFYSRHADEIKPLKAALTNHIRNREMFVLAQRSYIDRLSSFTYEHRYKMVTLGVVSTGVGALKWYRDGIDRRSHYDMMKGTIMVVSSKAGDLLGSVLAEFHKSFRTATYNIIFKPTIENMKFGFKEFLKVLAKNPQIRK